MFSKTFQKNHLQVRGGINEAGADLPANYIRGDVFCFCGKKSFLRIYFLIFVARNAKFVLKTIKFKIPKNQAAHPCWMERTSPLAAQEFGFARWFVFVGKWKFQNLPKFASKSFYLHRFLFNKINFPNIFIPKTKKQIFRLNAARSCSETVRSPCMWRTCGIFLFFWKQINFYQN